MSAWLILLISCAYLFLLFGLAYWADTLKRRGHSLINNPYVYALSLGVFCTAWTFYGSVGRAVESGIGFLPIYLGPTLIALLWWSVLRKMVRITKRQRITSIADFISSRYGKSLLLASLVTVVTVMGIIPYIALQLKAISSTYVLLTDAATDTSVWSDKALYTSLILALFVLLFGTRDLDATERHEGLVAAIAFESIIKLVAFLAVGVGVVWYSFDGPADLWQQAVARPDIASLFSFSADTITTTEWFWLSLLSAFAVLFLPRQFQVAVIENVSEQHIKKAIWLFPLYLLSINVFVIPIAVAGMLLFPDGSVNADTFVISIPLAEGQPALALFVFIGGLSAATGMVLVAVVALSTMISNDLVVPVLMRLQRFRRVNIYSPGFLLKVRRVSVLFIFLMAYGVVRLLDESYSLVGIGLISFAAVAQFAPAIIGGLYWKKGTRNAALAGLSAGFLTWFYTLIWPTLEAAGLFSGSLTTDGAFGLYWLRPQALFGLTHFDAISHAAFWSLLFNVMAYGVVALFSRPSAAELSQAAAFVDVFQPAQQPIIQRRASRYELERLLRRFLDAAKYEEAMQSYRQETGHSPAAGEDEADESFINYVENVLGGIIGAASARTVVSSIAKEKALSMDNIMLLLDETRQARAYSKKLEEKSSALQQTTEELRQANKKLRALDEMKDEFIFTVTHELKTPLTSIRAFTELLRDHPETPQEKQQEFLDIIGRETQRLSRLISQILDAQRVERGLLEPEFQAVDLRAILKESLGSMEYSIREKGIHIEQTGLAADDAAGPVSLQADPDQIEQILLNLLSNAVKCVPQAGGRIRVHIEQGADVLLSVEDNGPGVPEKDRERIFEKFEQVKRPDSAPAGGTGLGLSISRALAEQHGGALSVGDAVLGGAAFLLRLPVSENA